MSTVMIEVQSLGATVFTIDGKKVEIDNGAILFAAKQIQEMAGFSISPPEPFIDSADEHR